LKLIAAYTTWGYFYCPLRKQAMDQSYHRQKAPAALDKQRDGRRTGRERQRGREVTADGDHIVSKVPASFTFFIVFYIVGARSSLSEKRFLRSSSLKDTAGQARFEA